MSGRNTKLNVVLFAGGTGGFATVRSLIPFTHHINLTHVCGTWDDGGGSGVLLANGLVTLAPGDPAQGLLASASNLSDVDYAVFRTRDEHGQSLINRMIAAFEQATGSFALGLKEAAAFFRCRSNVLMVTMNRTHLRALTGDSVWLEGEHQIDEHHGAIRQLELISHNGGGIEPNPEVIEAIEQANIIILGPGSSYTSVLPNFLVDEVRNRVQTSLAPLIGIANLANDGQTLGWTAYRYGEEYSAAIGRDISVLLANDGIVPDWLVEIYQKGGQDIVQVGQPSGVHNFKLVTLDLISRQDVRKPDRSGGVQRSLLRHPPHHLGASLLDIFADLGFNRQW